MRLRVGCRFEHEAAIPTAAIALVEPHLHALAGQTGDGHSPRGETPGAIVEERWRSEPSVGSTSFVDVYGNRCRRLVLPEGASTSSYDALVTVSPEPDPVPGPDDVQHRIEALPDELLHWLLASRLCESDLLSERSWELFGDTEPGAARVQAV